MAHFRAMANEAGGLVWTYGEVLTAADKVELDAFCCSAERLEGLISDLRRLRFRREALACRALELIMYLVSYKTFMISWFDAAKVKMNDVDRQVELLKEARMHASFLEQLCVHGEEQYDTLLEYHDI